MVWKPDRRLLMNNPTHHDFLAEDDAFEYPEKLLGTN